MKGVALVYKGLCLVLAKMQSWSSSRRAREEAWKRVEHAEGDVDEVTNHEKCPCGVVEEDGRGYYEHC